MKRKYTYDRDSLPQIVCAAHLDWVELYDLAWKIAFQNIEYPQQEGWRPQLTCMPNSGNIWQWDSCFMTLFARYSNGALPGLNNLDNLYRRQRDDGYLSMAYKIKTGEYAYGERINPPLFAWVEWEYFLVTGDEARLVKILPVLRAYYDWIKRNRRRANGLYWFEDTNSSGMDNSPRSGCIARDLAGSDVCFVDLAGQQALSAGCLAKIARRAGDPGAESYFLSEHKALAELINQYHWNGRTGFYYDVFNSTAYRPNCINTKTVAAFWPILANVADDLQITRLLEHLLNPDKFWTPHPVPSLSRDDPNYEPLGGYWLGSVWPPANYMIASGLARRGWQTTARDIALRHLTAMAAVMKNESYGGIWEAYAPEYMLPATVKTRNGIVKNNFVGWSGLGPIAMLIEHIFGLSFDAATNTIRWNIAMPGEHGIRNLRFNGKTVALVCGASGAHTGRKIRVQTSGKINLKLSVTGRKWGEYDHALPRGEHELKV